MELSPNAEVLESEAFEIEGGWFAAIRYRLPGQREAEDMFRSFQGPTAEQEARSWLETKLKRNK